MTAIKSIIKCLLILIVSIIKLIDCEAVTLYALFNSVGIKGNVTFYQKSSGDPVKISIHLDSVRRKKSKLDTNPEQPEHYSWSIYSNPVFYGIKSSCNKQELGKLEHKLNEKHGAIIIPPPEGVYFQEFFDPDLNLDSQNTIWSKSLSLSSLNKSSVSTCSNIFHQGEVKTSEALFTTPFAGKVIFRENELSQTMIYTNLFTTSSEYKQASKHDWKILVTDILDTKNRAEKCGYLSSVFDPNNLSEDNCNIKNHAQCKMGELSKKHGPVTLGSANNRYSKFMFMDTNLPLSSFVSSSLSARQLYLVIYEKSNRILGCAQIREVKERQVKADFDMDGVSGFIRFSQRYLLDPTVVTVSLRNLMGRGKYFHIHEFPVPPPSRDTLSTSLSVQKNTICSEFNLGSYFNPFQVNKNSANYPSPGDGSNDEYMVGDLSGKFGPLTDGPYLEHHLSVFVDLNLPLFGSNSIIGRSVVINNAMNDWIICGTINYPDKVVTAEATFYYPVYGKAIFKQIESDSLSETSVFVDLSYSDITVNETDSHGWNIHSDPTGGDFYNWTKRCASAGEQFNPFEVGDEMGKTAKCSIDNPLRCPIGDLTSKSGKMLSVSAYRGSRQVKLFYTDTILPLSGPASVIGRSLVIHDDNAPMIRGRRMACTVIKRKHALSASVRKWRVEQGTVSNVSGFISFHQDNIFDKTIAKVTLHGLNNMAGGYHVHEVSVPPDREFPCSSDSVYGHYNPLGIDVSVGPLPAASTTDQYELGDLSGKFGLLSHMPMAKLEFVDHNLPLFGARSIIGRSLVIHKKEKSARWVCGTIQPEIAKDEGREIVAIASFDDSRHAVSGYVRFRQLEYKDGSTSPTWLEVDLRHGGSGQGRGQYNRNVTDGHSWSIFVNQVGEDAFNDVPTVKCLASGFKWNPYLSASDNKYYKSDCNSNNILRCEMGDLTGKHGPLVIGGKRMQLADDNLPLVGNFSIINRCLVIFTEKRNNLKMACANIKPDIHLVSSIAVRRHPTFTVAKFMDHVRDTLESAPWLISPDLDQTKLIINGECIQISIHFYGADAFKNQLELSNLINFGTVRRRGRKGEQTVSTFYRPCRSLDELNNPNRGGQLTSSAVNFSMIVFAYGLTAIRNWTWN